MEKKQNLIDNHNKDKNHIKIKTLIKKHKKFIFQYKTEIKPIIMLLKDKLN